MSVEHQQAQELGAEAGLLVKAERWAEALSLYEQAADLERKALEQVPVPNVRSRGILGISLASLLFKARCWETAELTIHSLLSQPGLLPSARIDLRELLKAVWEEQAASVTHSAPFGEAD